MRTAVATESNRLIGSVASDGTTGRSLAFPIPCRRRRRPYDACGGSLTVHDVTFRERAIHLEPSGVLALADLHVGRDEASSVSFPLGERDDLTDRFAALLSRFDPDTVVFAGDIVHTFDGVSEHSRDALADLARLPADVDVDLVMVAGNHDTALATAWDGPIHDEYVLERGGYVDGDDAERGRCGEVPGGRTVVCHGHEPPETAASRYVLGHVHPTIEIEGNRHPCVLFGEGTYRGADVVLLPAFNRLAPGVVVNDMDADEFDTPLVTDPDRLRPFVYDPDSQETLRFPPLGEFRDLL